MRKINRICIDVDGVLADFVGGVFRLFGVEREFPDQYSLPKHLGISDDEFWNRINLASPEFWENLDPYPWAHELYDHCSRIGSVILLTSPNRCPQCLAGKYAWMQKHFGEKFSRFLIGPAKEMCARPDTVLIDDSESNCASFINHNGWAICFPQPWNRSEGDRSDPFGCTKRKLQLLSEALKNAEISVSQ